jgi:hypothetical protein
MIWVAGRQRNRAKAPNSPSLIPIQINFEFPETNGKKISKTFSRIIVAIPQIAEASCC